LKDVNPLARAPVINEGIVKERLGCVVEVLTDRLAVTKEKTALVAGAVLVMLATLTLVYAKAVRDLMRTLTFVNTRRFIEKVPVVQGPKSTQVTPSSNEYSVPLDFLSQAPTNV
jgi:hypothetical protein